MNASTINVRSVMVASRVAGDKFRFSRATVGFALAAVAIAGMGAALQLLVRAPGPAAAATAESVGRVLRGAVSISPLLVLLLAVVGMASEFRHRTATTTFILTPRRSVWLAGQAIASVAVGAAVCALAAAAVVLVAALTLLAEDGPSLTGMLTEAAPALLMTVLVAGLYALIGTGVGALLADQTGAIVAVLIWILVVEPLAASFAPAAGRYLPGALADGVVGLNHAGPSTTAALLLLLAYAGIFLMLGAAMLRRRDIG